MLSNNKRGYLIAVLLLVALSACKKYLEKKPLKTMAVPASLNDLQALLDNSNLMNCRNSELAELIADNVYVTTDAFLSGGVNDRSNYTWERDANSLSAWKIYYQFSAYYANVVLDNLPRMTVTAANQAFYNQIKGAALFYRSFTFWQLAQLYCSPYSAATAGAPGIPVRTTSSIETPSSRGTVQQTYDQILSDFKTAASLLPLNSDYVTKPDKTAAYGALARTYLSMGDYENAGLYADSCLKLQGELIDFNSLLPVGRPPVKRFNKETVFHGISGAGFFMVYPSVGRVDSLLYRSYDDNDLRKTVFFYSNIDGSQSFRGSYDGDYWESVVFNGIAVDEVLLIRAECYARAGNTVLAMRDINQLMEKRWRNNGSFVPFEAATGQEALAIVLRERRKELLYRGLRWSDLRRLNIAGENITITRLINNVTYQLKPDDLRWVLLIPQEVINLSGMPQNKR